MLVNKNWTSVLLIYRDLSYAVISLAKLKDPLIRGVFMHLEGYLDQTYKKSLMNTLSFCCFLNYSHYTLFHLEVENLKEIFKKNSYPSGIRKQSIKSFLNKLHIPKKVIASKKSCK